MTTQPLATHRKTLRLAHALGSMVVARGSLELIWDYCAANATAVIGGAADVEAVAQWAGEPGALAGHLLAAGFLDETGNGFEAHDFWHHAPKHNDALRKLVARGKAGPDIDDAKPVAPDPHGTKKRKNTGQSPEKSGQSPEKSGQKARRDLFQAIRRPIGDPHGNLARAMPAESPEMTGQIRPEGENAPTPEVKETPQTPQKPILADSKDSSTSLFPYCANAEFAENAEISDKKAKKEKKGAAKISENLLAEVLEIWKTNCADKGLPAVRSVEGQRLAHLAARLADPAWLADFEEACRYVGSHPGAAWMRGRNERGWRADFDHLLRPGRASKIVENARSADRQGGGYRPNVPRASPERMRETDEAFIRQLEARGRRVLMPAASNPGA